MRYNLRHLIVTTALVAVVVAWLGYAGVFSHMTGTGWDCFCYVYRDLTPLPDQTGLGPYDGSLKLNTLGGFLGFWAAILTWAAVIISQIYGFYLAYMWASKGGK